MNEDYTYDKQITQNILNDIEEQNMSISYIVSDGYCPGFGYSIGLFKKLQHPELIILGLNPESTGAILNNIKSQILNGTNFIEGVDYHGFLVDLPIQFIKVHRDNYKDYLGYAGWYYEKSFDFPVLQVVWPDNNGRFPWENNFNKDLKFAQPLLDRNSDFKFLEERNLAVFTTESVINGEPILNIYHEENGDWQFHGLTPPDLKKAKLVSLESLVKLDKTLNDIYYLNFGESAYRNSPNDDWKINDKEKN
jgi:hypothetical protein